MERIEDVILSQIDLTSKVSKQYSQKEFDKLGFGITVEQWIILKIVSESSSLSQKELANKSYRDPASITRTIDLLEKKGLLIREKTPSNRRAYNIFLTKDGEQFIKDNIKSIDTHRDNSIKNLTQGELSLLSTILKKIRKNMK